LIGIQRRRTARLIKNVRLPILRLVEIDKPSASTVHGLIPAPAVIINDSPKPNKVNPKHRINTVSGDGEKFRGLSELQLTFGTDLTEKIFMVILDNV
jgi:hypothetical protein